MSQGGRRRRNKNRPTGVTRSVNTNMLPAVLLTLTGEEDKEALEDAPSVKNTQHTLTGDSANISVEQKLIALTTHITYSYTHTYTHPCSQKWCA